MNHSSSRTKSRLPWLCVALALVACKGGAKSATDDKGEQTPQAPATSDSAGAGAKLAAATPESAPDPTPAENVAAPADNTFITYNLGLIPAVGLEKARLPKIIQAMKETRASVACLQEVWTKEDADAIIAGLRAYYPHSFAHATEKLDTYDGPVCNLMNAMATQQCAAEMCTPKGISLSECVTDASLCKAKYDAFSDECKRCLAANTESPTTCATGKAPRFSTQGRNGLLLLSWDEITDARYTELDTQLVGRGVITATIKGRAVQCTHLSADLDMVPYPTGGAYQSWADEHKGELSTIDKAIEGDGCRVLMGDLNTGPALEGMVGELAENFPAFEQAGFVHGWKTPECTFCPDNPLAGVATGRWIDHVFFKGCDKAASYAYKRVFDQPIQVESAGNTVESRLSDHYGVLVEATGL